MGVECTLVEEDLIDVDGLLDDWGGIRDREAGNDDAGIKIQCAQTRKRLILAFHVRDDTVIRTSKRPSGKKQDALTFKLGAGRAYARAFVAPGTRGFEPVTRWRGKKVRDPVQIADSGQQDGWSVEVGIPLDKLPAWGRGTPKLVYKLRYADRDGSGKSLFKVRGTIRFAGATDVYLSFMKQANLRRSDLLLDQLANVDGHRGVERVIAGGRIVGVLTDEYRYLTLPVKSASDVRKVKVMDLGGDGHASIMTVYREHGNGGSRDVLAVWNLESTGNFARALAVEVRKQLGNNILENDWTLEPRKTKRGRKAKGYELVVSAGKVRGWDEDSYDDVPPQDMRPILTPWAEETTARYYFEGGQAFGGIED